MRAITVLYSEPTAEQRDLPADKDGRAQREVVDFFRKLIARMFLGLIASTSNLL